MINSEKSMELQVTKGDKMPIRTLPVEVRSNKIEGDLYPFLKALLSLDDSEKNVDRLPSILLMIEKSAYSMSFEQIKDAFIKYANNQLPGIKPRSNYLDGILFSNVMQAYRDSLPQKKHEPIKLDISEDEKQQNAFLNIVYAFDDWVSKKEVSYEFHTAYDELKARGFLETPTKEESKKTMEKSKSRLIRESATNRSLKESLRSVLGTKNERDWVINYGKCELLSRFFKTVHEQKKHIKDLI